LSYSYANKARVEVNAEVANDIMLSYVFPDNSGAFWDGKELVKLSGCFKEERLPILVGDADRIKLLGSAKYPKGSGSDGRTGEIIAEKTKGLLDKWKCAENVKFLVFDTCFANTGHVSAACIRIQEKLNKPLLWFPCRHHIGEVILSAVNKGLKIEVSKSPESQLYQKFQQCWDLLPHHSKDLNRFDPSSLSESAQDILIVLRENTIKVLKSTTKYSRDDYKEFRNLTLSYLNEVDQLINEPSMQRPGAMHKARWMANTIYTIKILLLTHHIEQLPANTILQKQQKPKLENYGCFIVHLYASWWFTCPQTSSAPWNDLQLYQNLLRYKEVNNLVASSALEALGRHKWYLTGELVIVSLFSEEVPVLERSEMAKKLVEIKPVDLPDKPVHRFGSGYGKPSFPGKNIFSTIYFSKHTFSIFFVYYLIYLNHFIRIFE
jgi:hypothetical protein